MLSQRLADELMGMPLDEALPLARAFGHFLNLTGIAELHHRYGPAQQPAFSNSINWHAKCWTRFDTPASTAASAMLVCNTRRVRRARAEGTTANSFDGMFEHMISSGTDREELYRAVCSQVRRFKHSCHTTALVMVVMR
jgi:hypothetical protein